MAGKLKALTKPDLKQCQADITTTAPFMQMGGPPRTTSRCKNVPTVLVREEKPGPDGQRGSMTVCDTCLGHLRKQRPTGIKCTRITPKVQKKVKMNPLGLKE
jgi:hypothetical protein